MGFGVYLPKGDPLYAASKRIAHHGFAHLILINSVFERIRPDNYDRND